MWSSTTIAPAPPLRGFVRPYVAYNERSPAPVNRIEAPQPHVVVVINTGAPLTITDQDGVARRVGSLVAGLGPEPSTVGHAGSQRGVELRLSPPTARRLLGVPLHELSGQVVGLVDLLGAAGRRLEEQVVAAASPALVGRAIDAALADRLQRSGGGDRVVAALWSRLVDDPDLRRVEDLIAPTGWSRRRAAAAFREHIGVTPKIAARIIRLDRAIAMFGPDTAGGMAGVALRSGFADQAHLIREFNALVGMTPGQYERARLNELPGIRAPSSREPG